MVEADAIRVNNSYESIEDLFADGEVEPVPKNLNALTGSCAASADL